MTGDPAFAANDIIVQPAVLTDCPSEIFRFIADASARGHRCALVTLIEIVEGAARSLGAHMAVCDDGRYCGFVSGGCVEAAVALEALHAIHEGADRLCRFGKGSPYFDIVLPCGGGIGVAIHVLRNISGIAAVLSALTERKSIGLAYCPRSQSLSVQQETASSGWSSGVFVTRYTPDPKVLLLGDGIEAKAFAVVASSVGIEVVHANAELVSTTTDVETAIILLQHDIDRELPVLRSALRTDAFYIGCLGSRRTHARRKERLEREGFQPSEIDRIHAPIGLFGPARGARSIAVSVLAEILSHVESRRL